MNPVLCVTGGEVDDPMYAYHGDSELRQTAWLGPLFAESWHRRAL